MTVHAHTFTPEQLKSLHYLRAVLPVTSAIVAGGWVRDAIAGVEPRDVDVFVASSEIEDALAGLLSEPGIMIVELRQDTRATGEASPLAFCESSGEHVESVWQVEGPHGLGYPLQIIEVADPLAWVPLFDAHCNMLYVALARLSAFEVVTCSPFAVAHAKLRVWEVNPNAQESKAVLMCRADKFEARDFEVRRAPVTHLGES